ncbi:hypothetical protein V8E53_011528, partial [Lactarius tabidus]
EEMAAASLDVNFMEELRANVSSLILVIFHSLVLSLWDSCLLQHSTQVQIRFFIAVLQQIARADPMTALLSPAVGELDRSQICQYESQIARTQVQHAQFPLCLHFQYQPFDSSSFLSPDSANSVGNPSDAAATLAQQCAKLKAVSNAAHRISAPALATSGECDTWAGVSSLSQVAEQDNSPTQDISIEPRSSRPQGTDFSGLSDSPVFRSPRASLDALSPAMGDSWASMVSTPLLPMFQKSSTANNNASNHGQTVDLATAKLNDLYGGSDVPRLDGSAGPLRATCTTTAAAPPPSTIA